MRIRGLALAVAAIAAIPAAGGPFDRCDVMYEEYPGITCVTVPEGGCGAPPGEYTRHKVPKYNCVLWGSGCTISFGATTAIKYTYTCVTSITGLCVCPTTGGSITTYIVNQDRC
ncbi:MAG: hypothetical protein IT207_11095 [Fimbriimonadaceae bacterium]|nr:hypothetical protein [Fimbriimonadaceae bacterium]